MAPPRRLLIFCLVLAALVGCRVGRSVPELLSVSDIAPRTFTLNDRVDVSGRNLPVGQVAGAKVVFLGDLHRPGEAPLLDQVIEVDDARLERDRVSFDVNDAVLERFTGRGDGAKHTTFRGRVEVRLPGASDSMPVVGSLHSDITIDVVPREPSKKAAEAIHAKATDAQSFFGWTLDKADGTQGGLAVRAVRPGSPAQRAGLKPGDVIVSFAGVDALSVSDAVPSGLEGKTPITFARGEEHIDAALDTQGYRGDVETGLTEGIVVLATLLSLLVLFGSRLGQAVSFVAHRLREEIAKQRAHGGSFVAALLRAAAYDATRTPRAARGTLAALAPALVAAGVSVSFAALPFVELKKRAELDIGILYLLSVTALLAMGLVTGGWGAARSIFIGRARALLEVVVCELPAACALGAVVVTTGSLHVRDIVLAQSGGGGSVTDTGGWPWAWNALKSPQLFLLFALFFVTALVDGSRAEGRTSGGSARGSLGSAAFFFAEWTHVFVMCGLGTIAFLGGYSVPGVSVAELYASAWWKAAGCALFLAKCWLLVLVVLLMRASLPRVRPDVVLRVGVKTILPACVVAMGLTALSVRYPLLPTAERAVGLVTMCTALAAVGAVVVWVYRSVSSVRLDDGRFRARVNPFL